MYVTIMDQAAHPHETAAVSKHYVNENKGVIIDLHPHEGGDRDKVIITLHAERTGHFKLIRFENGESKVLFEGKA